jgi:hypothetical protein
LHRNEPNEIYSERTRKDEDIGLITAFQLNPFRYGDCFKMGLSIAMTLVWARFY